MLPYGPQCRVQKVECRNHLLRNYCQKLMMLSKRADYPIDVRKKITTNILRMRTDITCAINFRKSEDKPLHRKIAGYFEKNININIMLNITKNVRN